jgi:hypothetical protein
MIGITESGVFGRLDNEILGDVGRIGSDTVSNESTV